MTPATLHFLRRLCDRVTLQVSDPNFAADAHAIIAAIEELDHAIQEAACRSPGSPSAA